MDAGAQLLLKVSYESYPESKISHCGAQTFKKSEFKHTVHRQSYHYTLIQQPLIPKLELQLQLQLRLSSKKAIPQANIHIPIFHQHHTSLPLQLSSIIQTITAPTKRYPRTPIPTQDAPSCLGKLHRRRIGCHGDRVTSSTTGRSC